MIKSTSILISFLLFSITLLGQSWSNNYTGAGNTSGIITAADGNKIIQSSDGSISKIDPISGSVIWSLKDLAGPGGQVGNPEHIMLSSIARVGNRFLAINYNCWRIFEDSGTSLPTEIAKGTWDETLLIDSDDAFPVRVKQIDDYFVIVGGLVYFQASMAGHGSGAHGFATKIDINGNVQWNRVYAFDYKHFAFWPTAPVFISDVEKIDQNSLMLSVADTYTSDESELIEVNSNTGVEVIYTTIYTPSTSTYGIMDMEIVGTNVWTIGYLHQGIPYGGSHSPFLFVYDIPTGNITFSQKFTTPLGDLYPTQLHLDGNFLISGILREASGSSSFVMDLSGNGYKLENSVPNFTMGVITESHALHFDGNDWYVGGISGSDNLPIIIKKSQMDGWSDLNCVVPFQVTTSALNITATADSLDFLSNPINDLPLPFNIGPGLLESTACCLNPQLSLNGPSIVCYGDSVLISLEQSASSNTQTWYSSNGGTFVPVASNESIMVYGNQAPGTYSYCAIVTSGPGCIDTVCIDVIQNPQIIATGNTVAGCVGDSVTLCPFTSGGPYFFDWGDGPLHLPCSTVVVSALGPNIYPVIISNLDGCTESVDMIVNTIPTPLIHVEPYTQACAGDDVTISVTTNIPTGLTWTNELGTVVGTGTSIIVDPIYATTYTVTSALPCPVSATVTVVPLDGPATLYDSIKLCETDTISEFLLTTHPNLYNNGTLTVNPTGVTNPLAIETYMTPHVLHFTFDPEVAGPGEHIIEICDNSPNGCCSYVTITVCPAPTLNLPAVVCASDAPITMHPQFFPNGVTGITYSGDISAIDTLTNQFDPGIAPIGISNFTACYILTDGNQCCRDYSIEVMAGPTTPFQTITLCELDSPVPFFCTKPGFIFSGNITVSGTDSLAQAALSNYMSSPNLCFTFDPGTSGPGTYTVEVCNNSNSSSCCTIVTFNVCPVPVVSISNFGSCDNNTTLTANMGSASSYCSPSFTWSGPGIVGGMGTSSVDIDTPGLYTVVVTTVPGCTTTETIMVDSSLIANPIVVLDADPCIGDPPMWLTASASGGNSGYTFQWDFDNDGQFDDAFGPTVLYSAGVSTTICYRVTDANGCEQIQCVAITYHAPPFVFPITLPTTCEGAPIFAAVDVLDPCSSMTWQWYADGVLLTGETSSSYSNTSPTFSAGTVISVEVCCFGCCSQIDVVTIEAIPNNSFASIPDINLCTWDGTPIPLIGTTDVGFCYFSGPGVNNFNQTFDPIAAGGVGSYVISYTCATSDQCSSTIKQIVNVVEIDAWHQSTLNTQGFESANDVVTDSQGNVYVVGTYRHSTFLGGGANPDIQIVSNQDPTEPNAYIAKYDECANLLWVANTINAKDCEGTSITLDEVNDVVYMGGNILGHAMFTSSQSSVGLCVSGYNQSLFVLLSQGYVAQFDASTGCLNFAEQVSVDNTTKVSALTVNELNGDIFVGGTYAEIGASPTAFAGYVRKYSPQTNMTILNTLQSPIWSIRNSYSQYSSNSVNDVNFDETSNRIYMIGNFKKYVSQNNGTSTTSLLGSNASVDAYVALYNDLPIPTAIQLHSSSVGAGNWMTGEGISIDPVNGNVYFTGSFNGSVADPFSFNSIGGTSIVGPGQFNGYMIGTNSSFSSVWTRVSMPTSGVGAAYGRDVVAYNNRVSFLGEFAQDAVSVTGFASVPLVGMGGNKVVVMAYDNLGSPLWINTTQSVSSTGVDNHTGMAIENNRNGFSYVVGQYGKVMSYMNGNPSSGDLSSSITGDNAYIMRVDESNSGAFRNSVYDFSEESKFEDSGISILAIPNPASDMVRIKVIGINLFKGATLQLIDAQGRVVYSSETRINQLSIDVSSFDTGLYLIKLVIDNVLETKRLIIN